MPGRRRARRRLVCRIARTLSGCGLKVFFYRSRSRDGALREIRLGEVAPLTLSKARDAVARKRVEREQGKDPQLEKRKERAKRDRLAQRQATYTLENLA